MTAQDLDDGLVGLRTLAEEKPEKDMAIWDFAFSKFPSDKAAGERLVANVYSAFWKGEFAPDGLTLLQDQSEKPGPEAFNCMTRAGLAEVALGQDEFAALGEAAALKNLALWNISDYRKIRDGYRYYFCPDDDAGGHKRGLCANAMELEDWYEATSNRNSSDHERLGRKLEEVFPIEPKPAFQRFRFPYDKDIYDKVTEALAFDASLPIETTIRNTALDLNHWPEEVEKQERLVDRLKRRLARH